MTRGPDAASSELLRSDAVHVWYERGLPSEHYALRGVGVSVRAGDRVGLLGASGSGKTTLLHVLARLQAPDRGAVHAETRGLPSLVFQFPERQLFAETVREEVSYGLAQSGVLRDEIETRVHEALEQVGLPQREFAERAPFHLSGGERRRVALASILAQRRDVVLLDEPTLGLDRDGVRRLEEIMATMHGRGVAYWVASHDTDFVAATCTQLVVLADGEVAYRGPAQSYWADPERAQSHGVRAPRAARLAARLRMHGVGGVGDLPSASELAAALAHVHHKHEPPG